MGKKIKVKNVKTGKVEYYEPENIGPFYSYEDLLKLGLLPGMRRKNGTLKTFSELSEERQKEFSEKGILPEEYKGGLDNENT